MKSKNDFRPGNQPAVQITGKKIVLTIIRTNQLSVTDKDIST